MAFTEIFSHLIKSGASGIYGPFQDVCFIPLFLAYEINVTFQVSRLYANITDARLVDSSGQWAIPCSSSISFAFTFGYLIFLVYNSCLNSIFFRERNYTLQPTDYIIGPASGNPDLCLTWPRALPPNSDGIDWQMGNSFCLLGIDRSTLTFQMF